MSRRYFFLAVSFLVPLGGLFVYATSIETGFFVFLTAALSVNVIILMVFYRRLKAKRALIKLQKEEFFEKGNLVRAELGKEAEAIDAFREKIVAYSHLKGLVEKLSMSLTVDDTVRALCCEVASLFERSDLTVILYLFSSQTGELAIANALHNSHRVNIKKKQGDVYDRWIMKTLQPLYLDDAAGDFRFDYDKLEQEEARPIRSLLSVPLVVQKKPVGILRLDSPFENAFREEDLRFLKTIGDVGAVALENAELYDKVEDLAIRDGLTGLYLRRYLMERLAEEIARHYRHERKMSFLMIDLDHFKRYNDRLGHAAGDIVLRHLSDMMREHFSGAGNLLCRYGGEEFCVMLPECGKDEAGGTARTFVKRVAEEGIVLRREETHVTISVGVASFPENAKTKEDLIQKADEALYEAKKKGRNRVCIA